MTLITLFFAFILDRFWDGLAPSNHRWFLNWHQKVNHVLSGFSPKMVMVLSMGISLLVLFVVDHVLGSFLWGIGAFIFEVIVLALCLGPGLLDREIDQYIEAREQRDGLIKDRLYWLITGHSRPLELSQEIKGMTEGIFYQAHIRWFSVVFWFLLFGIYGAAFYRISVLLTQVAEGETQRIGQKLYGLLGWVPARMTAFFFGLVGSLDAVQTVFRSNSGKSNTNQDIEHTDANRRLLMQAGCASIGVEMDVNACDDNIQEAEDAIKWIRKAKALVLRAVLLWLAVSALWTMFGF